MLVFLMLFVLNSLISIFIAKLALENGMSALFWFCLSMMIGVICIPLFVVHKNLLNQKQMAEFLSPVVKWSA